MSPCVSRRLWAIASDQLIVAVWWGGGWLLPRSASATPATHEPIMICFTALIALSLVRTASSPPSPFPGSVMHSAARRGTTGDAAGTIVRLLAADNVQNDAGPIASGFRPKLGRLSEIRPISGQRRV